MREKFTKFNPHLIKIPEDIPSCMDLNKNVQDNMKTINRRSTLLNQ